eukprot:TRINITY_DN18804_c0_g1_i1.p1 TRINITY_DN18804_c0_g1~~TRINITY_DN18804_c0_g1_i1.p1  ORF type:complete len:285 (-),score=67.10 TRINITY_DN18804_c0_g1_i1:435-1289(-)
MEEYQGIYEGEVSRNEKNGEGCYLWYNGNFYNGTWKHGLIDGYGTLFYAKGGFLKGNFYDGKLNGLGHGMYNNGDIYIGLWSNGAFHGKGLYYTSASNKWQLGNFANGTMTQKLSSGKGRPSSLGSSFRTPIVIKSKYENERGYKELAETFCEASMNFSRYHGDIVDGMRDGNGTFIFEDGSFYAGTWKKNSPCGVGLFFYTDGKFDAGIYSGGLLNGYGRAQYSNGDVYEGYFKNGSMNGLGLYHKESENVWLFGYFIEGVISKELQRFTDDLQHANFSKLLI